MQLTYKPLLKKTLGNGRAACQALLTIPYRGFAGHRDLRLQADTRESNLL